MELLDQAIARFVALLDEARQAGEREPTAMTLATVTSDGRPAARTVLLKHVDRKGFVFYTNTLSDKGRQLAGSAHCALVFHWKALRDQVQVRVEGSVEPVSAAEADAYFGSRPRISQIGAWASLQSQPLDQRATLEQRFAEFEAMYQGREVPRPPHWSGYRVQPARIELWFGMTGRLHDREVYVRGDDGRWQHGLLYP